LSGTSARRHRRSFPTRRSSDLDAVYTKAELLVDDEGMPQKMPWEDWREGEDLLTSGWMRATAPSGDADFVGQVGWSGELGYGVRDRKSTRLNSSHLGISYAVFC